MKINNRNSLGFVVPVKEYESYEEADKAAGVPLQALKHCNNQLYYTSTAGEASALVCLAVAALTGIPRKMETVMVDVKDANGNVTGKTEKKNSKGEIVQEPVDTDSDYVKAALAASGKTVADLQAGVSDYVSKANNGAGLALDIKPQRTGLGLGKLAGKYTAAATKLIAENKIKDFAKSFKSRLQREPDINNGDGKPDATKLGWRIKEYQDAEFA